MKREAWCKDGEHESSEVDQSEGAEGEDTQDLQRSGRYLLLVG